MRRRLGEVMEKKVAALEAERSSNEGKWRWEQEMKDDLIKGLKGHRAKQSTMIEKLKAKLKEDIRHLQQGVTKRDGRIKYQDEEVEFEKRHKLEAQESARSDRLAADNAKLDLQVERSAHQVTQATIQALEARLAFLDSEAYKAEVVEKYRHSSLGKVKVALACKAGFDYLASLLPPESRPGPDSLYPSRVSCCLEFLKEIETRGGGVMLEVDDGDDEDEPGDDQEEVPPSAAPPAAPQVLVPDQSSDLLCPTPNPGREA